MKKLIAFLAAGSLLALTTGCPPAPSTEKVPPKVTTPPPVNHENTTPKTEPKIDKTEPKIDKTEPKIDKTEPKIDKTEPKIDKTEPKPPVDAPKTEMGKVEKGKLMVKDKEVTDLSASVKDELKNMKDGDVTVTMDKDGKITKVEEKK